MGLGNAKIRELYETEYPTLFRIACASGLGRSFADDMVQESFQALLERRDDPKVAEHENLRGWLVITLRNKIATELQRKWRHVEQPLTEISAITETSCEPSFRDSLPRQLTVDEKDLLCMYYELRLSHREIGRLLSISEAASRMRLIRARDSYEKWKKLEEKTEKKLLHRVQLHKYRDEEVLECPKRKEYPGAAGRAL
mgnify:FL=1